MASVRRLAASALLFLLLATQRTHAWDAIACDSLGTQYCGAEHCAIHPSVAAVCCDCHQLCCPNGIDPGSSPRSVRPPPSSCTDPSGTVHAHGDRWPDDPDHTCAWLSCDDGSVSVDLNITQACPPEPEGFDCVATRPLDHCCFEYFCNRTEPGSKADGADDNGVKLYKGCIDAEGNRRVHGEEWVSEEDCEGFSCFDGHVVTVPILCPDLPLPAGPGACVSVPVAGECCPTLVCPPTPNDCVDQTGQIRENGAVWVGGDACAILQCSDGAIIRLPIGCPPPPSDPGCQRRDDPGLCCPQYSCPDDGSCTDSDGVTRPDGAHWSSTDGCTHYECMSGMIATGTVTCQVPPTGDLCREVPPGPGQCCPTYRCDPAGGGGGDDGADDTTVCLDADGLARPDGDHWASSNNCTRYTCYRGAVLGVSAVCLPPPPGAVCVPVIVGGACCPVYRCATAPADGACLDSDSALRPDGSHWTSADGCQQFTCDNGQVLGLTHVCVHVLLPDCQPQTVPGQCCPDFNCTTKPPKDCVNPDGSIQPHGTEALDQNGCPVAGCFDGVLSEIVVDCPQPPRSDCALVDTPGQCCPTISCPDDPGRDCSDPSGISLAHNTTQTTADGCITYSCLDGRLSVEVENCIPRLPGCLPVYTPGVCCPDYHCPEPADCEDPSGQSRPHDSNWTSADGCTVYTCFNGVISSSVVSCVIPPDVTPACLPVHSPGQCCPEYVCPNYGTRDCRDPGGQTRQHDSTWTSADACTVYRCSDGTISSETVTCASRPGPDSDCVPRYTPGQCCPTFVCPSEAPQDCTDANNVSRPHNSSWSSADGCTVYNCLDGVISGRAVRCAVPPDYTPDCRPVFTPAQCCPEFDCSDVGPQDCTTPDGQAVPHNITVTSASGCTHYHCNNGDLSVAITDCARPPSQPGCQPVFTPGQCCPRYDCPEIPEEGCVDADGQVRPDRAVWATANNCTRYVCEGKEVQGVSFLCVTPHPAYGQCAVTFIEPGRCCPRYSCTSPPANGSCLDSDGALRPAGSHWTSADSCHHFTCDNGQVLGLTQVCVHVLLPGCRLQTVPGQCCPYFNCTLPEPTGKACVDLYGRTQPHNSTWTTPDGCVRQCTDGEISIIDADCPEPPGPNCYAIPPQQDRCCPTYHCPSAQKACQGVDGRAQPHNSTWTTEDGCVSQCTDGVSIVIDVDCPQPPGPNCLATPDPDRCCPVYHCPTADTGCVDEGRQYLDGQSWLRPNDCVYRYSCDSGEVSKTEIQCPPKTSPGCLTIQIPNLCCPVYDCTHVTTSTPNTEPTTTKTTTTTTTPASTTEPAGADCVDATGQPRPSGSFWRSEDGCTNHACADGVVFNATEPCPPPPDDPTCVARPGTCCPTYQCGGDGQEPEPGCSDATGTVHAVNQLYLDNPATPTACYVCAAGSPPHPIHVLNVTTDCPRAPVGCTEHFPDNTCCPDIKCPGGLPCIFEGVARAPGEEWRTDPPCASYVCVLGVSVQTNRTVCRPFPTSVCTARYVPGQCCPVPDCPHKPCTYAGREHEHDTTWPLDPLRPCTLLSCRDGEVLSEDVSTSCPPPPSDSEGCTATAVPYRCCPAYDCVEVSCQYNGTTYSEGQLWVDDPAFPCKRFNCTRAGVTTVEDYSAKCAPRPHASCTASRQAGTCCKHYLCPHCEVGGVQHPHGSAWWEDSARHCRQSVCSAGAVSLLQQHADCPTVPEGCTPLYKGTECCHYQYTCPNCSYDPYGNPVRPRLVGERRRRREARRARGRKVLG